MQNVFKVKLAEVFVGQTLYFTIDESSLINFYLELPKDVNAVVEIAKTKGTNKLKASTADLKLKDRESFLKVDDFRHQNVI